MVYLMNFNLSKVDVQNKYVYPIKLWFCDCIFKIPSIWYTIWGYLGMLCES